MSETKSAEDGKPKSQDYYFQYYSSLQNQANMIGDIARTSAYRKAILGNGAVAFQDKLVIDVGAGSGILSFFAAQAGAMNVKSIEASAMANKLRILVEQANRENDINPHLRNRIQVLHGKVEDPKIQEMALSLGRVDTIISEPIGVMLFHERMVESFLLARDLFLKPDGALYPSQGRIWFSLFSDETLFTETVNKAAFFQQNLFGTNFSVLADLAREEVFAQPVVGLIPPNTLMTDGICARDFDFYTLTLDEIKDFTVPLAWVVKRTGVVHGIGSWFDLGFFPPRNVEPISDDVANDMIHEQWDSLEANTAAMLPWSGFEFGLDPPPTPLPPMDGRQVRLDTGPFSTRTHWQQARLLLNEPLAVNRGETVTGHMHWVVNDSRSYDLTLEIKIERPGAPPSDLLTRTAKYDLAQQCFNYSYTGEDTTRTALLAGMASGFGQ